MTEQENKMAEEEHTTKSYFSFVFEFKNNVIVFYARQKQRVENVSGVVYEFLSPVISFFAFFYWLFWSVISGIQHGFQTVSSSTHCIINFEYKQFFIAVLERPKEYFSAAKIRLYQIICVPIRRRAFRVRKSMRKKFLDVRIYLLGFRELCRRLFLLVSDYTPGGQWTVITLLLIAAIFIGVEVYRYSRLVFQFLDHMVFLVMFVLSPVLWTLRDLWKVIAIGLDMLLALFKYCCYLLLLCVEEVFDFIVRVLYAFSSGIYKCLVWFLNLRFVKFIWQLLLELTLTGLEAFIFKVVPFLAKVFSHVADFTAVLSSYFYNYFVAVYSQEETWRYWSNTRVFAAVMTVIALLVAYRYRKRFPTVMCNEIENDARLPLRKRIKSARSSSKNSSEGDDEVNFKLTSSAHICIDFLLGDCTKGRRCDNHHCPWPYHWQYRVPVQGWKSFSEQDCDKIEKLFCNPVNEITKTSEISPDLSAMTRRSHAKSDKPIKLDFQDMRMEVSYHRLEIRRLSTESWTKCSDELATKWIWYRLTDKGEWAEYDNKTKPKQEDIEKSFLLRESSYNYKKNNHEYRINFYMTPMYERNMNPREYKRRFVQRRPCYRSLDEL